MNVIPLVMSPRVWGCPCCMIWDASGVEMPKDGILKSAMHESKVNPVVLGNAMCRLKRDSDGLAVLAGNEVIAH